MAFDLTKPSMLGNTMAGEFGNIRENFRAQVQGDANVFAALSVKYGKFQAFILGLKNAAGTLQHEIAAEGAGLAAASFADKITGASNAFSNTPLVTSGVGFTAGGGIDNATQNRFVFNVPDQNIGAGVGEFAGLTTIAYWSGGATATSAPPIVRPALISSNVNGVTQYRLVFQFFDSTGAAWNINTTNLASGKEMQVMFLGLIK
jgi:hypothetical protein